MHIQWLDGGLHAVEWELSAPGNPETNFRLGTWRLLCTSNGFTSKNCTTTCAQDHTSEWTIIISYELEQHFFWHTTCHTSLDAHHGNCWQKQGDLNCQHQICTMEQTTCGHLCQHLPPHSVQIKLHLLRFESTCPHKHEWLGTPGMPCDDLGHAFGQHQNVKPITYWTPC